jgi:formylglycine-generating enzyme
VNEETFLAAIVEDPAEPTTWLALADWLEEQGDPRGELLRLTRALLQPDCEQRPAREERLRFLLGQGVRPCWPTRSNALGMRFAWCPPGTFVMGSPPDEEERWGHEQQHRVTLTRGLWLGVTPVTQAQWQVVMGSNPSHFWGLRGGNRPADQVSWNDCQEFNKRLAERDGKLYRLPTEAEWEYACRAGTTTPFSFGATISTDQANYDGTYTYGKGKKGVFREETTLAGSFPANAWGLYDMHGNVWEWCQDWYGPYPEGEEKDPRGSMSGDARVLRGGSWYNLPKSCRSAAHSKDAADARRNYVGCRVVLCLD